MNRQDRLERAFAEFDEQNPHVWELFRSFAFDVLRSGRRRYSARLILSRIAWHVDIETNQYDGYKLNNNHSPYYARKWAKTFPQYDYLFEFRVVQSEVGRVQGLDTPYRSKRAKLPASSDSVGAQR